MKGRSIRHLGGRNTPFPECKPIGMRPVHTKSVFSCGPSDGEKLFDPRASGRKGQECPQEIRTKMFMFMLPFLQ